MPRLEIADLELNGPLEYFAELDHIYYKQIGFENGKILIDGSKNKLTLWATTDGKYICAYPDNFEIDVLKAQCFVLGTVLELTYRRMENPDVVFHHDFKPNAPAYITKNRVLIIPADLNENKELTS